MSRIGKVPVKIPQGVQVTINGQKVEVKGTKGTLSRELPEIIKVEIKEDALFCSPKEEREDAKALWGLTRQLIENMVIGVTAGYKKELEVVGVGYKFEMKGKDLVVSAGLSYPVTVKEKPGIVFRTEGPTKLTIEGIDKQLVGQIAADIRAIRKPEPYKGKGVRYSGEAIRRKAGKTAGK